MPNIELHGYGDQAAAALKERIRLTLQDSPDADEIVITTTHDDVEDLKTKRKMPFLRIITQPRERADLLGRLALLNEDEDIEVIELAQWMPKKKKEGGGSEWQRPLCKRWSLN